MTPGDRRRPSALPSALPSAVLQWAAQVVERVTEEPLLQHTSVFVARQDGAGVICLVLAGQRWAPAGPAADGRIGTWELPLEGSVCGRVVRSGMPALVVDVHADPDYRGYPGSRTRSELAVPISAGGRVVGVINLESRRVGGFAIADLDRVTALADEAGLTFEAAGLGAQLE